MVVTEIRSRVRRGAAGASAAAQQQAVGGSLGLAGLAELALSYTHGHRDQPTSRQETGGWPWAGAHGWPDPNPPQGPGQRLERGKLGMHERRCVPHFTAPFPWQDLGTCQEDEGSLYSSSSCAVICEL